MKGGRPRGHVFSQLHPIWRGIGCALIILIPLIAYGLADVILGYVLTQNPNLAASLSNPRPGEADLFQVQLIATAVLSVILYMVFSILGSLVYSLLGGNRNAEIVSRIGSGTRR